MLKSKFSIFALTFVIVSWGCCAQPLQGSDSPSHDVAKKKDMLGPEDVTEIRLVKRSGGPPFLAPGASNDEILLVPNKQSARYFNRLAKEIIDNGFLKLKSSYQGRNHDAPVVAITLKCGNQEKTVENGDRTIETNPTFLFEVLIRGADAEMNGRHLRKE